MSNANLYMNWINDTSKSLEFKTSGNPEHGKLITPDPSTMAPVGQQGNTTQVFATSNSSLTGPGPEGTYQWEIVGSNPTVFIDVSYNHPFGSGTTTVSVTCPAGYQVEGCDQGPAQSINLNQNCSSLQDHDNSQCTLTVTEG